MYEVRMTTGEGQDRISNLPVEIISQIHTVRDLIAGCPRMEELRIGDNDVHTQVVQFHLIPKRLNDRGYIW